MLRIGITGANGFLGWHLRAHLHGRKDILVTTLGREEFGDDKALADFIGKADAVVHLAGVNRAPEDEVMKGNIEPARRLVAACKAAAACPHVLFANSTQYERDTAYGTAKRTAGEVLAEWAQASSAPYTNLILPHLFGESGRPFYNSAIATFCHQIAGEQSPRIIVDSELELVHAQRVSAAILSCIESGISGDKRIEGFRISVSEALERIRSMASQYAGHVIPALSSQFELDLFNTYRSYLFPAHYPRRLEQRSDARGDLFEAVKSIHGGQGFVSSTHPGITRGNHYHRHKFERFLVLSGEARIRVRKLFSSEVTDFRVNGQTPAYIDMPALHTHNITNTGPGELLTLFWSHEFFDPGAPDTFTESV